MTFWAASRVRHLGPVVIGVLVVAQAVLWMVARPAGEDTGSYVGQLTGVEAVLMLSIAIVLVSTLPLVDVYFDGIDKAAVMHRRLAITGMLLVLPHILMSHRGGPTPGWAGPAGAVATIGLVTLVVWAILPRWRSVIPGPGRRLIEVVHEWAPMRWVSRLLANYEIWRDVHRATGLFLALAFAHGLADGSPFPDSPLLRWTYVATSGTGLAFYLYRELIARRGHGLRDYQVREVNPVGEGLTEIVLHPLGRPFAYHAGQFAMMHLETKDGWHRHPFTLASSPNDPDVRVTVKALGDFTTHLQDAVRPGMPAVLSGPHGGFTHAKGTTEHQVWVAGGVGVTPFLSWLRSLDHHKPPGRVDFFYAVADEAPYAEEIRAITQRHPEVRLHVVRSQQDGRLTVAHAVEASGADPDELSVFMCGPEGMVSALQQGFRDVGVPQRRIFREYFDWR
jgi:predicted ferric reductase